MILQLWTFVVIVMMNFYVCAVGIKLKNVTVPVYGVKDGLVRLGCEFELDSDSLLVLKWYKDEQEFFRFTPPQQILIFPAPGVFVDKSQSGLHHVVLKDITLDTSGVYKCEVSAEGSFRTLSGQGSMVVIAPPESVPEISGIHSLVNVGDVINGNCSSSRSKPATTLTLYVNDEKPEQDVFEYTPSIDVDGLESSFIGFKIQVEPRHFRHGIMIIKCTATIGNFYWIMSKNVSNANINAQPSFPGHNNRLSSVGSEPVIISSIIYQGLIYYVCIIIGLIIL